MNAKSKRRTGYEYSAVHPCPCCGERVDVEIDATVSGGYRRATILDPAEYPDIDVNAVRIAATGRDISDDVDLDSFRDAVEDQAAENAASDAYDAAESREDR